MHKILKREVKTFLKMFLTVWFCLVIFWRKILRFGFVDLFFFYFIGMISDLVKVLTLQKNHGHDLKRLNGPQINGGEKW